MHHPLAQFACELQMVHNATSAVLKLLTSLVV